MRQVIALLLALGSAAFATLPSCTKPIPSIDTAIVPKVIYVDQNDNSAFACINEQGDTLRAILSALGGSTGAAGLSSTGDLKATIDRDSNTTGARFWVANHTNDSLFRVKDDSSAKFFGSLAVAGTGNFTGAVTFAANPIWSWLGVTKIPFQNESAVSGGMTSSSNLTYTPSTSTFATANGTFSGTVGINSTLNFGGTGSAADYALWRSAGAGLSIRGGAGSSYDFAIFNPAASYILRNPTGTTTMEFPGAGGVNFTGGAVYANTTIEATGNIYSSSAGTGFWMNTPGTFTYGMYKSGTSLAFRSGSASDFLTVNSSGQPTFANKVTGSDTVAAVLGLRLGNVAGSSPRWYRSAANMTTTPESLNVGGKLIVSDSILGSTARFSGAVTFGAAPKLNANTASQAVFTDGSKNVVSNPITGTGNVVMSASPTLTGTVVGAASTWSGNVTADSLISSKFYTENTFTITATGMVSATTGTARYVRVGKMVTLYIPNLFGTSNSTTLTLTGLPAAITPAVNQNIAVSGIEDNSLFYAAGIMQIQNTGIIQPYINATLTSAGGGSATYTNSGSKGVVLCTVTYTLQ